MRIVISSKQDNNMKIHIINSENIEVFLIEESEEVNNIINSINEGIEVESNFEKLEEICKPEISKNKERLKEIRKELDRNINIHSLECANILLNKLGIKWNIHFSPKGNKVRVSYKKSNIYLPDLLIQEFLDNEDISRYKKFWRRCLENKIPYITQQLFNWIKTNGVRINKNGLLVGFRGAEKIKGFNDFVTKFLDSPKATEDRILVYFHEFNYYNENAFKFVKRTSKKLDKPHTIIANSIQEISDLEHYGLYTHWFNSSNSNRKFFTLHSPYKESKIDINPNNFCGSGIHAGSIKFGISSFGSSRLGCLICPSKVGSVPHDGSMKLRAYEIFPLHEFKKDESLENFHKEFIVENSTYLEKVKFTDVENDKVEYVICESNKEETIQEYIKEKENLERSLEMKKLDYKDISKNKNQ